MHPASWNTSSRPVPDTSHSNDLKVLICIALATVVIHLILGNRYGIHRDELATLDDARHLAWGYVAYPPVTPFFGRLSLALFGTSIRGFRFFANIAMAIAAPSQRESLRLYPLTTIRRTTYVIAATTNVR